MFPAGDLAAPEVVPKMHYRGFLDVITRRHHIIYQNWPVRFERPSAMGIVELRTLYDYLMREDAPPLFRKLSPEEWESFEQALSRSDVQRDGSPEHDEHETMNVDEMANANNTTNADEATVDGVMNANEATADDVMNANRTTVNDAVDADETTVNDRQDTESGPSNQTGNRDPNVNVEEHDTQISGIQMTADTTQVGNTAANIEAGNPAAALGSAAAGAHALDQPGGLFGVFNANMDLMPQTTRQSRWDARMTHVQKAAHLAEQAAQEQAEADQAGIAASGVIPTRGNRRGGRGRGQAGQPRGRGQAGRARGRGQAGRGQAERGRGQAGGARARARGQAVRGQTSRGRGQATRESSHGQTAEGSGGSSQ